MRRLALLILAGVVILGCSASTPAQPNGVSASVADPRVGPSDRARHFVAHLDGAGEVPARDTLAQGQALFMDIDLDAGTISYRLMVANINNVIASHIHIAPAGVNGPIVLFLFGNVPAGGGPSDGVLAAATKTAANLIGPLAGHPLSDLIAAMEAGNAYVNVHTNDGVDGVNTGPGDFPGGEIRGQLQEIGPDK